MNIKNPHQDKFRFRLLFLHPRYWLTWMGLGVFFVLVFFPMPIIDWLGYRLGSMAASINKKRFSIVKKNLAVCFPDYSESEIEEMACKNFQTQFRSVLHYCILWWRPVSLVRKKISTSGFEKIDQYKAQGKQVIILLVHNVGLEFAVASISMDYAMSGPYKSMKNPVIDWFVANGRMRFGKGNGTKIFTREDGMRPLIRETRKGKVLIYLADEDLGADKSIFSSFYGVKKATIPVLGRLAKSCDAVVLPCACCYDAKSRRYEVKLLSEIKNLPSGNDEADSLRMNKAIEQVINICPLEYLWSLRYFKTRPAGEPPVYE